MLTTFPEFSSFTSESAAQAAIERIESSFFSLESVYLARGGDPSKLVRPTAPKTNLYGRYQANTKYAVWLETSIASMQATAAPAAPSPSPSVSAPPPAASAPPPPPAKSEEANDAANRNIPTVLGADGQVDYTASSHALQHGRSAIPFQPVIGSVYRPGSVRMLTTEEATGESVPTRPRFDIEGNAYPLAALPPTGDGSKKQSDDQKKNDEDRERKNKQGPKPAKIMPTSDELARLSYTQICQLVHGDGSVLAGAASRPVREDHAGIARAQSEAELADAYRRSLNK